MTDEPILPPLEEAPEGEEPERPRREPPPGPRARLRSVARKILEDETTVTAKELIGALLTTSDRAKTEMVRAVGREVRAYLEGLGTTDLLDHLVNDYELEVSAKLRLRPLREAEEEDATPG